jgi:hypothetical protein
MVLLIGGVWQSITKWSPDRTTDLNRRKILPAAQLGLVSRHAPDDAADPAGAILYSTNEFPDGLLQGHAEADVAIRGRLG